MIVDLKYVIHENLEIFNVLALEKAKIPTKNNKVLSLPILLYNWNIFINFWISFQTKLCMNYAPIARCMDNGHVTRAFFKNIQRIGNLGRWAKNIVGYFQLNAQHTFCHCVYTVQDFSSINYYFKKKLLRHFYCGCKELGI